MNVGCAVLLQKAMHAQTWLEAYAALYPPRTDPVAKLQAMLDRGKNPKCVDDPVDGDMLSRLGPGEWYSSNIIRAFANAALERVADVRVLVQGATITGSTVELRGFVRGALEHMRSEKIRRVVIAVNSDNSHWAVACVDETTVAYYDSKHNEARAGLACDAIVEVAGRRQVRTGASMCCQQPNDVDCGVYACMNMLHLVYGAAVPTGGEYQNSIARMRALVATRILECCERKTPEPLKRKRLKQSAGVPDQPAERVVLE